MLGLLSIYAEKKINNTNEFHLSWEHRNAPLIVNKVSRTFDTSSFDNILFLPQASSIAELLLDSNIQKIATIAPFLKNAIFITIGFFETAENLQNTFFRAAQDYNFGQSLIRLILQKNRTNLRANKIQYTLLNHTSFCAFTGLYLQIACAFIKNKIEVENKRPSGLLTIHTLNITLSKNKILPTICMHQNQKMVYQIN